MNRLSRMLHSKFLILNSFVLAALVSGCMHAQARTVPVPPPLDVPPPPPRVIEAAGTEAQSPPVGLIADPAPVPPSRQRASTPPPRTEPKPEPPKPESPPLPEVARPAEEPH